MSHDSTEATPDPLLLAARSGHIDIDIARTICLSHGQRVQRGIEHMFDDQGGATSVGRWKTGRSR